MGILIVWPLWIEALLFFLSPHSLTSSLPPSLSFPFLPFPHLPFLVPSSFPSFFLPYLHFFFFSFSFWYSSSFFLFFSFFFFFFKMEIVYRKSTQVDTSVMVLSGDKPGYTSEGLYSASTLVAASPLQQPSVFLGLDLGGILMPCFLSTKTWRSFWNQRWVMGWASWVAAQGTEL